MGIVLAVAVAMAADTAADVLLARVKVGITADVADSSGVACMESVERTRFLPRRAGAGATCAGLIAAIADNPRGAVEWHDRLRLTVIAGPRAEEFALTDASRFESHDIAGMLRSAAAGRGEFSTFLRNLIEDAEPFEPRGVEQTSLGRLFAIGFAVPPARSHLQNAAAYRGALYALADSNELKRLTLVSENGTAGPEQACRSQYTIDYAETRIGDREIVLPQSSTMDTIYGDGKELHSETFYSSCRRPRANPAAPDQAATAKPMPPNIRLKVRFQVPIDGETAATGDPVIGVIRTTLKDKQNGIIVHAGDRLHGRIASIEEYLLPHLRWNVAIVFETIERGVGDHGIDQGVEQPVTLAPLDDGDREPHDEPMGPAELQKLRPPGGGYFVFHDANLLIDKTFEMEWETR
jgi:hypothetical protein